MQLTRPGPGAPARRAAHLRAASGLLVALVIGPAWESMAAEVAIGRPKERLGIRIAAVYTEPVSMDEYWGGEPPELADIHLEADVQAVKGNRYGFRADEWIPYLSITYALELLGAEGKKATGQLWQMMATDGPHYGVNIKMFGPGHYRLTYRIGSPAEWGLARHTDPKTGVAPWWEPFEVTWTFDYPVTRGR
jgi:hypothetical protein